MKIIVYSVLFASILLTTFVTSLAVVTAQSPPQPEDLVVVNGPSPGTVVLEWEEFPDATSYRIGWLAVEDYTAYIENDVWRQKFAYSDVIASETYTVSRLTPGIEYYLIVGRIVTRSDNGSPTEIAWSGWERVQLHAEPSSCPAAPQTTTPPQTSTQSQTFTPPTDGDYDSDDDGLIEIFDLAQLNAIRWNVSGAGKILDRDDRAEFNNAFPGAVAGMGCPGVDCSGYELVADLDFDTNGNGQADAGDAYWNDGSGWAPVDLWTVFDGGGHTISNLYINRSDRDEVGLFGDPFVSGVVIRNLGLLSVDVTGGADVGGLVGDAHSITITDSYVTGSVAGAVNVGGLIGDSYQGTVTGSYSTASVTGSDDVGGLIGNGHSDTIAASYATGDVIATGDDIGGLIGYAFDSTISASYAAGDVTGDGSVGGLVGNLFRGSLASSYSTGTVSGESSVGGLIGLRSLDPAVSVSYWDTQTSGQSSSDGGIGKTTAELQSPTGYTGIFASWNIDLDGDGSNDDPRDFGTSTEYPVLKYSGPAVAQQSGSNTATSGVSDGDCSVGLTVNPGESCTYPGTNLQFSVDSSGTATLTIGVVVFTDGDSLEIQNATVNGVAFTFVASKQSDGSWLISEVG